MIISKTKYTKKVYDDFANYSIKSSRAMNYVYICSGIILAFSIAEFVIQKFSAGVLFLFLGLLFALYGVFMRIVIKLANKNNFDTIEEYYFDKDRFTVKTHNKEGQEIATSTINYACLYEVKRYKDYGYIYLNKAVAYIIEKSSFEKQDQFELVLKTIQEHINQKNKSEEGKAFVVGNVNISTNSKYKELSELEEKKVIVNNKSKDQSKGNNQDNFFKETKKEEQIKENKRIEQIKETKKAEQIKENKKTEPIKEEKFVIQEIKKNKNDDKFLMQENKKNNGDKFLIQESKKNNKDEKSTKIEKSIVTKNNTKIEEKETKQSKTNIIEEKNKKPNKELKATDRYKIEIKDKSKNNIEEKNSKTKDKFTETKITKTPNSITQTKTDIKPNKGTIETKTTRVNPFGYDEEKESLTVEKKPNEKSLNYSYNNYSISKKEDNNLNGIIENSAGIKTLSIKETVIEKTTTKQSNSSVSTRLTESSSSKAISSSSTKAISSSSSVKSLSSTSSNVKSLSSSNSKSIGGNSNSNAKTIAIDEEDAKVISSKPIKENVTGKFYSDTDLI